MRRRPPIGWLVAAVAAAAVAFELYGAHQPARHVAAPPAVTANANVDPGTPLGGRPAPAFALTDQFGHRRSLAAFRGKIVGLAFVDSRCAGLCPLTVQVLQDAARLVGPHAAGLARVAINANPRGLPLSEPPQGSAARAMLRGWTFLSGPLSQLRQIWRDYGVEAEAVRGVDMYTAATYIIGPRGREQYIFVTDSSPADVVPEAYALARKIAGLMPGHVALAPPSALRAGSAPKVTSGRFRLTALSPAGAPATIAAGTGRTELVDFFATWCHACQKDLRVLNAYAARQRAAPAALPAVVAVDLRLAEPSTAYVRTFVLKQRLTFPVGLDSRGSVTDAYGVTALPTLALVGAGGQVRWRHVGALPLPTLMSDVRSALAASAGGG